MGSWPLGVLSQKSRCAQTLERGRNSGKDVSGLHSGLLAKETKSLGDKAPCNQKGFQFPSTALAGALGQENPV